MANTIKIKNSGTASNVPASLEYGELGLNYADGKLFYKNSSGNIVEFSVSSSVNGLSDVTIDTPLTYQGLMYDGTEWVNSSIPNIFLVRNNSGSTILKGTLVAANGAEGSGRIDIVPYESTGLENAELRAMGILTATLTDGQSGNVMSFGTLKNLDTRGTVESGLAVGDETWSAGDILYAHPTVAGKLTKVQPQHNFAVAFITVLGNGSGQIVIRVNPGNNHLEWQHDVSLTSPTSGDFLKYNGSVWVNDPINLGTDTVGNYMSNVSAGTGISISHTPSEGSTATITNDGVTSVTGTANQITASSSTGGVTLSLPTNVIISGSITANTNLISNYSSGDEGGEINLAAAATNTTLSGPIKIDVYQNKLRFYEGGASTRGAYIDLTATGSSVGTNLLGTSGAMNYEQQQSNKVTNVTASGATIVSRSFTTSGYPVQVLVTGDAENSTAGAWIKLQLYRDSTPIGKIIHVESSAGSENVPYALTVIDTPDAGTYVYSLKTASTAAAGSFNFGETDGPVLTMIELAGRTGATGPAGSTTLDGLTDVTAPTPNAGEYLAWNGSAWVNSGIVMADIQDGQAISSSSSPTFSSITVTNSVVDHVSISSKTGSYTLVLGDDGKMIEMNVGSANNLTVPADNTVDFPVGTSIDILQVGAGQTTIVATSGVTINRSTGLKLRTQWSAATLIKRAANTWVAIGDLSA